MAECYLLSHPWIAPVLWMVLYASDYYLTLWGARLAKRQSFFENEGSYELTPEYQEDVDKQRRISRTFFLWLLLGAGILLLIGVIPDGTPSVYGGFVGWFLVAELIVHMRHVGNILYYRRLNDPDPGVSGHMVISRAETYRRSSVDLACIGAFTLLACAISGSTLLLGGGLHVLYESYNHLSLARRARRTASETTEQNEQPEAETADAAEQA